MVKGLKSMWRQAPPIVRSTLQGVLTRIIMQVTCPLSQPMHICTKSGCTKPGCSP